MPPTYVKLLWTAFRVPKEGQSEAECEDAYAADAARGRFAIADGASESAFAGVWAEMLAQAHVAHGRAWSRWLAEVRGAWQGHFQDQEMPWYLETKFDEGAFATLLGLDLRVTPRSDGRLAWRTQAVGDSCVFQVRGDQLQQAFPIKRAADFDSRPWLVGSRPQMPGAARCKRLRGLGSWQPGDAFLLMTDALAQWLLQDAESGGQPWTALRSVRHADGFAALVAELRDLPQDKRLRNDDTTLMVIETETCR
jgi:hypothetical protein